MDESVKIDGYTYHYNECSLYKGDFVFNALKGVLVEGQIDSEQAKAFNGINEDHGRIFHSIWATDDPKLVAAGIQEKLSAINWYKRLPEVVQQEVSIKYSEELRLLKDNVRVEERYQYIREREAKIITDEKAAQNIAIIKAAIQYASGKGMMSYVDQKGYEGFINGAKWAIENNI